MVLPRTSAWVLGLAREDTVNKLAALAGVAGLTIVAALTARGHAADRAALPAVTNPMADIADLYAWMTGANLNLVMDVSPLDDGSRGFDPGVVYVFHVTSKPGLGVATPGGVETRVICQFASSTSAACWVVGAAGTKEYVAGDPSGAGMTATSGKLRVFAGRRSDPAFSNQAGFASAVNQIKPFTSALDADGCPTALPAGNALAIRNALVAGADSFGAKNVMALVVQLDKSLVNDGAQTVVAVWGSTHTGTP